MSFLYAASRYPVELRLLSFLHKHIDQLSHADFTVEFDLQTVHWLHEGIRSILDGIPPSSSKTALEQWNLVGKLVSFLVYTFVVYK